LQTEGGLGLVLLRKLVDALMRGQVELRPNQPQGLCMRIILPDSGQSFSPRIAPPP
jgi:signal transduction histidine kinase